MWSLDGITAALGLGSQTPDAVAAAGKTSPLLCDNLDCGGSVALGQKIAAAGILGCLAMGRILALVLKQAEG